MNFLISFPRSGQHLTESILRYLCESHGLDYSYCEYYKYCCKSIPCKKGSIFQKNHDFEIENDKGLLIDNDSKYLTLFRKDPILQLESYYRLVSKHTSYNYDDLLKFVKGKLPYYNNFIKKWINNDDSNILKVEYYELINNVVDTSEKIFNHFYPETIIDKSKIDNINNMEFYSISADRNLGKVELKNTINDDIYKSLKRDLKL